VGLTLAETYVSRWRSWALPAVLALAVLALQMAGTAGVLRYDRAALAAGEPWRLLTGHLVHLGWAHLGMNLVGLLLVWLLVGPAFGPVQWIAVTAGSALLIDAGFWWLSPTLQWYVGLSGLLHAMLVAGAVAMIAGGNDSRTEALVLLLLVAIKIAWEQFAGPLPGSEHTAGGPVVIDAHLYGAVAGAVSGGLIPLLARQGSGN
jgi:rhomboid family GlyGly-CTERM serine protease